MSSRWLRIIQIVGMAIKFLVQMLWYRFRNKSSHQWDQLLQKQAREFKERAIRMQGLLIKYGQFLSTRGDMLPKAFIDEISQLVDQVPASGWDKARLQLEQEWGKPYHEILQAIQVEPVASASIGEVYQATLLDGSKVAVKIQRTGIDNIVAADFKAIKIVMWLAERFSPFSDKVNFPMLYKEMKTVIERELDFNKELDTAREFKKKITDQSEYMVPDVYPAYSTKKVLVMEWIDAHKVTDLDFIEAHQLDRKLIAERLLKLFIPQWLGNGKFHADPHQGNVLLNSKGQIILIDFGMIGEISKQDAEVLQQLIVAIGMKNYRQAVEQLVKLEFVLPHADKKQVESLLEQALSIDVQALKQMDQFDLLKMKVQMQDTLKSLPIQLPTRFVFLGRAIATVEGLLSTLVPNENLLQMGKPLVTKWITENKNNVWDILTNWIKEQPLVETLQLIPDLLHEPRRHREWKAESQNRQFEFDAMLSKKKEYFNLTIVSAIFGLITYMMRMKELSIISISLLILFTLLYIRKSRKLEQWIRNKHSHR